MRVIFFAPFCGEEAAVEKLSGLPLSEVSDASGGVLRVSDGSGGVLHRDHATSYYIAQLSEVSSKGKVLTIQFGIHGQESEVEKGLAHWQATSRARSQAAQ